MSSLVIPQESMIYAAQAWLTLMTMAAAMMSWWTLHRS